MNKLDIEKSRTNTFDAKKRKQYGWKTLNPRGEYMELPKEWLKIDREFYQRDYVERKVLEYGKSFDWSAFNTISVAQRSDGTYWVIDGQHRLLAALLRDDIDLLPCMVFSVNSVAEEADAFVRINAYRRALQTIDTWKANTTREDDVTCKAQALVKQAGRAVTQSSGPDSIRCLGKLTQCVNINYEALVRIWPLLIEIFRGEIWHDKVMSGLFWLECNSSQSLTEKTYREKLLLIGYTGLLHAAEQNAATYKTGGAKVWGLGMLIAINRGRRTKHFSPDRAVLRPEEQLNCAA